MNAKDLNSHRHAYVMRDNSSKSQSKNGRISIIASIILSSFLLASIPIIYSFTSASTQPQQTTVPGEGTLWSVLGER